MYESKVKKRERVAKILKKLDEKYGTDIRCYLIHENTWQLLFAVIMSAQCTDASVNKVSPNLFKKFPDLQAFANADVEQVQEAIKSIGLYRSKAKNLVECAKKLLKDFNGEVPSDIESLISLPGVGRKTANVIRGNIYNIPSIVVDTHVKRISNKLALVNSQDPVKIEMQLMEILPKDHWILWNINIITLGRNICIARREKCDICFLNKECPSAKI